MANCTISNLPFLYGTNLGSGNCQRIKKNAFRKARILWSSPFPSHRDTLFSSYVMASEGPPRMWGLFHAYGGSWRTLVSGLKARKSTWIVPPTSHIPVSGGLQPERQNTFLPLSGCQNEGSRFFFCILQPADESSISPSPLCLPPVPHTNKCTVGEFSHRASSQRAFFDSWHW